MVRKRCGACHKVSYSLSEKGRWICPGCGFDLSQAPLLIVDAGTARVLPVSSGPAEGADLN